MSARLVGAAAFKAVGTGDPRPAGSIPVHLRHTAPSIGGFVGTRGDGVDPTRRYRAGRPVSRLVHVFGPRGPRVSALRRPLRALGVVGIVVVTVMLGASPVSADPARPGNTRSVVDALVPDHPGVEFSIVGGDAFVRVDVQPGVEVQIPGYGSEPYLWIRRDGTVWENRSSPAVELNRDRYLTDVDIELPTDVGDSDVVDWYRVDDGGQVVWHDHRAHWMGRSDPPTIDPSGLVQRWEIEVVVEGTPTVLQGSLYRVDAPSPAWWSSTLVGLIIAWGLRRRLRRLALMILAAAGAWSVVAWTAWWSLLAPARDTPTVGVLTLGVVVVGVVVAIRPTSTAAGPLLAGSAVALVMAGWLARDGVTAALIPGLDAPWLWRSVVPLGVGVGLVAGGVGLQESLGTGRTPMGGPRPPIARSDGE